MSFNNIGKGGAADPALHDEVQKTVVSLAETDQWVEEIEAELKKLDTQIQALSRAPAAEPVDLAPFWLALADQKQGLAALTDKVNEIQVPDITGVLDRLADLHTRIRFAEQNRGVTLSELERFSASVERRLKENQEAATALMYKNLYARFTKVEEAAAADRAQLRVLKRRTWALLGALLVSIASAVTYHVLSL